MMEKLFGTVKHVHLLLWITFKNYLLMNIMHVRLWYAKPLLMFFLCVQCILATFFYVGIKLFGHCVYSLET